MSPGATAILRDSLDALVTFNKDYTEERAGKNAIQKALEFLKNLHTTEHRDDWGYWFTFARAGSTIVFYGRSDEAFEPRLVAHSEVSYPKGR